MQYSAILQVAAEVVRTSMPAGELQQLGLEILNDSNQMMRNVEVLVLGCLTKGGKHFLEHCSGG